MSNSYPELSDQYITIHPVRLPAETPHADQAWSIPGPAQSYNFVGSRQKLSRAALRSRSAPPSRHSIAFVAMLHDGERETPIGYSQYSNDNSKNTLNLQVSVSTDHAGPDLARSLAAQLLDFAQDQGMRNVYARESRTDVAMQQLASQLNMQQAHAQRSTRSQVAEEDEVLIYTLGL